MDEQLLEVAGAMLWAVVFILVGIGAAELSDWYGLGATGQWLVGGGTAAALIASSEWVNDLWDQLQESEDNREDKP